MKKQMLILAAAAAAALPAWAESEIAYTYAESSDIDLWGATKAQTYDVAIAVNDPSLVGCEITRIEVPVLNAPHHSQYSVWLSKSLTLETQDGVKVNVPDVWSVAVEPQFENENDEIAYLRYDLPEPYAITDAGIYVGYTFKVAKSETGDDRGPVVTAPNMAEGGFWVHSSDSYRKWKDYSPSQGCVSPMVVTIAGDFQENAAAIPYLKRLHGLNGEPTEATIALLNHGSTDITTVECKIEVDGKETVETIDLDAPIPGFYNRQGAVTVTIPALATGVYDYAITITKVNGADNLDNRALASNSIDVLDYLPVKRTVMEEYTGTWCGWCVRGFVALEKMAELHDDFIAIAYHNEDPMQINYPSMVDGFPDAWMDRSIECDPYYGTSKADFGIEELWQSMNEEFTPVEIDLNAEWADANCDKIIVNSNVKWIAGPEHEGEYRVEYVLLADGLTDPSWRQSNYFYNYSQDAAPLYMEDFCQGGKYGSAKVTGLVFNDVAVQTSGLKGVEGSISNIEPGSETPYSYEFDIADNTIIQSKDKLRVVAMVLYANSDYGYSYGLVLNSNVCKVPATSGISSISNDCREVSARYYDVCGREVANPKAGIYVKAATMSDGTIRTSKVAK